MEEKKIHVIRYFLKYKNVKAFWRGHRKHVIIGKHVRRPNVLSPSLTCFERDFEGVSGGQTPHHVSARHHNGTSQSSVCTSLLHFHLLVTQSGPRRDVAFTSGSKVLARKLLQTPYHCGQRGEKSISVMPPKDIVLYSW